MHFDKFTAILCTLGWVSHFLLDWSEARRMNKTGFVDFIIGNPPALLSSITSTLMLYLMGPAVLALLGVQLTPAFDDVTVKGVIAGLVGYNADSLLTKLSNILRGNKT